MREATEQGLAVYEQLRGTERANRMKATINDAAFGASMTELSMDFVFGRVWAREGLDRRARSLVTLGILIALRQRNELKNHVLIALTTCEIEEVMVHASAYAGFPAARDASNAAAEALETPGGERGN